MQVETTRFGALQVGSEDIITFPSGIPGFEQYKTFIILPADGEQETPFLFLQSTEEKSLCFFLLETLNFFPKYEIQLGDSTIAELDLEKAEDVTVLTMVTVKDHLQDATTNLKAPIIMNVRNKMSKQIVLEKEDYPIKQPLFEVDTPLKAVQDKG